MNIPQPAKPGEKFGDNSDFRQKASEKKSMREKIIAQRLAGNKSKQKR